MEDRLSGLRKSMKKTTFKDLSFSEEHHKLVFEKVNRPYENEEDILLAILQLLVNEKTGFELTHLLRSRGIQTFEDNEGFLYTLLHRLEQNRLIQSNWDHAEAKYYQVSDKGRKALRKAEKEAARKRRFLLKELIRE